MALKQEIVILYFLIHFRCNFVSTLPTDSRADIGFNISVIHINDFHARFEELNTKSSTCKETDTVCIGGIARVYTAVNKLKEASPNALFLNAGDNFQGTLWYTFFKWNVTQYFWNKFPVDAYTLGNHEFDDGIAGVVPFLKALNAPVVVCNIDDSAEPDIQGLYNKSVVIERNGIRIGIVGVILTATKTISKSGDLQFISESAAVNAEADRLVAEENVDTIIVLSHCGYELEQEIAKNATAKIGLIVGAHSHTFLYTGDNSPGPDTPAGDYPTVVELEDGRKILVVQASSYTKYLGYITVYYNNNGDVIDWEGAPIYLDDTYEKDATIEAELQPYKEIIDVTGNVVVGYTEIDLPKDTCYEEECLMADVVADSYAYAVKGSVDTKYAIIGIVNAGGVRTGIEAGEITYGMVNEVTPFGNTIDYGYLQGKYLLRGLEQVEDDTILQVSAGFRVTYTSSFKVVSAEVYCHGCDNPGYVPIEDEEYYALALSSYYADVGIYNYLYTNMSDYTIGQLDADALAEYVNASSPITSVQTGRLIILSGTEETGSSAHTYFRNHYAVVLLCLILANRGIFTYCLYLNFTFPLGIKYK